MSRQDPIRSALEAAGIPMRATQARTVWTRSAIAEAFANYFERYGRWPTADDLNPSRASERGNTEAVGRFVSGTYPYVGSVYNHYSSWAAARAAGRQKLDARRGIVPPEPGASE